MGFSVHSRAKLVICRKPDTQTARLEGDRYPVGHVVEEGEEFGVGLPDAAQPSSVEESLAHT
jgi:hypothetical protein